MGTIPTQPDILWTWSAAEHVPRVGEVVRNEDGTLLVVRDVLWVTQQTVQVYVR
jgi:hypothetical protein